MIELRPYQAAPPAQSLPQAIKRFPPRRTAAIFMVPERAGDGWLALVGSSGWLFGSLAEAQSEACWLALNFGLPVREALR
jgi:hypothetical protein